MDGNRFDALAKGLAAPTTRRTALGAAGALGAGGLLGALGFRRAPAASAAPTGSTCTLAFAATVRLGPSAGQVLAKGGAQPGTLQGELSFALSAAGGIDAGRLRLPDGTALPVIGQATGRSLELRIAVGDGRPLVAVGVGEQPIAACQGAVDGLATGPQAGDLGDWHATAKGQTGGTSTGGAAPAATLAAGGAAATRPPSSPPRPTTAPTSAPTAAPTTAPTTAATVDTSTCPSGVTCGPSATCCQGPAGVTPSDVRCQGDACVCQYSCKAAGCSKADETSFFTVACSEKPADHCAEFGCGTSPTAVPPPPCAKTGESCATASCCLGYCNQDNVCECVPDGGQCAHTGTGGCCSGAPCNANDFCGTCALPGAPCNTDGDCCAGQTLCCFDGTRLANVCTEVGAAGACPGQSQQQQQCPAGQTNCGGTCVDLSSNAGSCGACGKSCGLGAVCTGGACVAPKPCLPDGADCNLDADCCGGFCIVGVQGVHDYCGS